MPYNIPTGAPPPLIHAAPRAAPRKSHPLWALVAHFFGCFLAGEQQQTGFGPATLALQTAASLGVPPAVIVMCLIPAYISPRPLELQAQDHFFLLTYGCVITAIVTVLTWERFLPTLLEARVLEALPIPRSRLFLGKSLAMALFLGVFATLPGAPAAVLLAGFAGSHHAGRQLIAHLAAIALSGWCTATSVASLLALASLLPRRLARAAVPLLQGVLLAVACLFLFFSPAIAPWLPRLVARHASAALFVPPFWFTGVYEVIFRLTPESARYAYLARAGAAATLISSSAFVLLYPLAYRRRARAVLAGEEEAATRRTGWNRLLPSLLLARYLPQAGQRASFYFIRQTMFRVPRLRAVTIFAACAGFALAATTIARLRILSTPPYLLASAPRALTATVAFLFVMMTSAYLCLSSNLEPRAAWLFDTTVAPGDRFLSSGVRRWALLAHLPAALAVSLALWLLIPGVAVVSIACARTLLAALAACLLLTEFFFHRFQDVPFASARLRRRGMPARALAALFVALPLILVTAARSEVPIRQSSIALLRLLAVTAILEFLLHHRRITQSSNPVPEEVEDEYFQRLGL